ncbi:excinuclease ABC subunit C [Salinarchaeum sp. IM2453]|uniref:excinuclease ABC subunit C n=1 Tax=Salinarchaeum sp. IM2453 TaxID=2862870 RepID=UPI001C82B387|nr:excinuclease ABC subunit C [Salinarchaeum sp. IM2453]QZA89442.1 excinuclease ABC subunit C [Salinarchaeum sp. IM2453]
MDFAALRDRAANLPTEPGVYLFHTGNPDPTSAQQSLSNVGASDGRVLYVGKAVDLRDRVRSYTDPRSERIAGMVDNATGIEAVVTDTETQALLLEANLIKRYSPRYNVRLKDDKSYPLIQLTNHPVPRIEITRDPDEQATVYGPFTNRSRLEIVLKAIRDIYGLRGCSDHKYANRDRPCLDYELGICTAPCTNEISTEDYQRDVKQIKRFFNGETGVLSEALRTEMENAAKDQAFERAATLRDRLQVVQEFHSDGDPAIKGGDEEETTDILGVSTGNDQAIVSRLHSENGQLIDRDRHTLVAPQNGPRQVATVISSFIQQYYADRNLPDSLLLPDQPDDDDVRNWLSTNGVGVRVPGSGRGARLVDLAMKNARKGELTTDPTQSLAADLGLSSMSRIEGFDVSHTDGSGVVGSNVTFTNGSRDASGYRRKRLHDENDDYRNMYTLLHWRATRAVEERDDRPDPDILLVDGGKGQREAAVDAITDAGWNIPTYAIAKSEQRDRILGPNGQVNISDDAHTLLTQIRDEAHRFAVQYHETVRDNVSTALDQINGVGPTTRDRLLRRFGSIDRIRTASVTELQDVDGVGPSLAQQIHRSL